MTSEPSSGSDSINTSGLLRTVRPFLYLASILVAVFYASCFVEARWSGWSAVAELYPLLGPEPMEWDGARSDVTSPGKWGNSCQAAGAWVDELGIYIFASMPVINPYPPILVPWETGVEAVQKCYASPDTHVYIHLVGNDSVIQLREKLARQCVELAEAQDIGFLDPDPQNTYGDH